MSGRGVGCGEVAAAGGVKLPRLPSRTLPSLQAGAALSALPPNVRVEPPRDDIDSLYSLCGPRGVLLAPSLWPEGFGLVCHEAGLRGVPAVTSDKGGLAEANPLPALVVATPEAHFDHATARVVLGELEVRARLGRPPPPRAAVAAAMTEGCDDGAELASEGFTMTDDEDEEGADTVPPRKELREVGGLL